MSCLTGIHDVLLVVLDYGSDDPPPMIEDFAFNKEPIRLPLKGVLPLNKVTSFYQDRLDWLLRDTNVRAERIEFYDNVSEKISHAYAAIENRNDGWHDISCLRRSLTYLRDAIELIMAQRSFDDKHPVQESELPTFSTNKADHASITWTMLILQALRPCISLTIALLELALPDRVEFWEECKSSLYRYDWYLGFTYDSKTSQNRTVTPYPRLADVLY